MILERWNCKTREYEPYEIPDNRRIAMLCDSMDQVIDCASCGREMTFGEGFTSLEFHAPVGFGYCVCPDCFGEESCRCWNIRGGSR